MSLFTPTKLVLQETLHCHTCSICWREGDYNEMPRTYTGMSVTSIGEDTIVLHIPNKGPATVPKSLLPDAKVGEQVFGHVNMGAETDEELNIKSLRRVGYKTGVILSGRMR